MIGVGSRRHKAAAALLATGGRLPFLRAGVRSGAVLVVEPTLRSVQIMLLDPHPENSRIETH